MNDIVRQEVTTTADKIVVKVGTRVLTDEQGRLDSQRIASLAAQLSQLTSQAKKVVLVSSGAVAAGMNRLQLDTRPADLAVLQAVAAVGQTEMMQAYQQQFETYQQIAAQVLLTATELDDRASYLNVRNTLLALLNLNIIPIVNENDTVAVEELQTTFGDNDRLAALVTNLLGAQLLIILSNVDGLYTGSPEGEQTKILETVKAVDDTILSYAEDTNNALSRGGMSSKLQAVKIVTSAGENVVLANGHEPDVITRILAGDSIGTLFLAEGKTLSPWKRWLRFSAQSQGTVVLDAGACTAIETEGKSLLAIGIVGFSGEFAKGDVISICNDQGLELARGLTNYGFTEIEKIRGQQSTTFQQILGYCPYDEVIHRDNLAVVLT
jgi:glutamate 5-kinase